MIPTAERPDRVRHPGAAHPAHLRVVTWNVWWRFDADGQEIVGPRPASATDWRDREPAILATLKEAQPDIVGLQEVWATTDDSQAHRLAAALGMHAAYGGPSLPPPPDPPQRADHDGVAVGVGVLSRWPVLATREHPLPSRRYAPTVALVATIEHPAGPLHVVVCCLDWEHDLAGLRLAQARALRDVVTDPSLDGPLPVVLTADLNAPPDTPEVTVLTEVMVDAWVQAGNDARGGHTLSSANPLAPRLAWQLDGRIDYVLVRAGIPGSGVTIDAAGLIGLPHDGTYPSDHYAVMADLRL